jgi:hypothetical protein
VRARAIVLGALAVSIAAPARAGTQVHFDIYMLSFSRADLQHAPLQADDGAPMSATALGLDHMSTFGLTPYVAPHFGLGIETWRWLFYVHGAYELWGEDNGGEHATEAFFEVESAPRWDVGPAIASIGPSAGVRWLAGDTWHTGARGMVGAEAELRLHVGGGSKHGPATMSMDWFLRLSCTFTDGPAWMLSFGEGWGSLHDEDRPPG